MRPWSSISIRSEAGTFGSPGMVMMSPVTITTTTVPGATVGVPYSQTLAAVKCRPFLASSSVGMTPTSSAMPSWRSLPGKSSASDKRSMSRNAGGSLPRCHQWKR